MITTVHYRHHQYNMFFSSSYLRVIIVLVMAALSPLTTQGCQEIQPWQTNITLRLTPTKGVWAASVGVRPDNNPWTLNITVYTNKKNIMNFIITSTTDTWQKSSWRTDTDTVTSRSLWPPHTHFLLGQTTKLLVMVSSTELTIQLCTSSTCNNNTWPRRHGSVISEANLNVSELSGGKILNICRYPEEGKGNTYNEALDTCNAAAASLRITEYLNMVKSFLRPVSFIVLAEVLLSAVMLFLVYTRHVDT